MKENNRVQEMARNVRTSRIGFPILLTALFFLTASLPVDLLGCRNRGLIAVTIALAGGILGIISAIKGVIVRARGNNDSFRYILVALIYAIPAGYIVLTTN